jgi:N-methylhydantoinase B
MTGMTWGTRVRQPVMGAAGGMPGDTIEYLHHRHDGTVVHVPAQIDGFHLRDDEWMEGRNATGGGFGDPLDRDAELVALDVATERLTVDEALEAYGVVIGDSGVDAVASAQVRDERRRQRLAAAQPAVRPVGDVALDENAPVLPLYPGVVQRVNLAVAERTGVVLAVAPDHWTDGCPTIEAPWPADAGVSVRTYLDPSCGRSLFVEVTPAGEARSWSTAPRRWTDAGEAR